MRILVTGGAGYIGSVLVPVLLQEGHEVTVLDSFMYNQDSLLDCCHHAGLTIVRADGRDPRVLEERLKGVDAIFPLACLTGAPLCDRRPEEARAVNLDAIRLLVKLRAPSQRIIFPTTNSGYGIGERHVHCTEEAPLRPVSLYGRLKTEAEKVVLDSGNSLTLRLATVFGISPRMRLDLLVNDFTYRAATDGFVVLFQGHFKRNFIHVRDVARAFLHVLKNFEAMKGEPYNVGLSDANLSKRELCEEIKKQLPRFYVVEAAVGEDPDQRDYIVSNAKIEKTGFRPQVSLKDGIAELIKGYQVIRRNGHANV
ncbi:MAG: NAD(P)-dependent oxidoreductase [Candidatus Omnitrophica bacterium]|nr:NAD(P)-dependent oxidoreductase [Candidatus Omnitrophota bacterium]